MDAETTANKSISLDSVLATFEIAVKNPEATNELWFLEQITNSIRTIGLSHPEATQIIVVFRK